MRPGDLVELSDEPLEGPGSKPPPSLIAIAGAFQQLSLLSFGGGLSGWAREVLVRRRGWLTDHGFLEVLSLIEPLPGPNAVQLAAYIGGQLRGWRGIFAAVAGLLGLPLVLTLAAGMLYFGRPPGLLLLRINDALRGVGLVAAGLGFGLAIRLLYTEGRDPIFSGFAVATFAAIIFGRVNLALATAIGATLAFAAETIRQRSR